MKRILIATDGSPSAEEAVDVGLELAREHDASVFIVHVAPAVDVAPWAPFSMAAGAPHDVMPEDRVALDEAVATAEARGVHASGEVLRGVAIDQIVAAAESHDVDLIVLGSRGHGAVVRAALGSVSMGVLHKTHRPVLVVRASRVPAGSASG
jgi:nucleotide-binding universal stress UspA family protein